MSYYGFPKYESVGEKKAKAIKAFEKLKKKNPDADEDISDIFGL